MLAHDQHVSGFGMLQMRIENDRRQRGQNPGPGTQSVMRDVEPEHGQQSVRFVLRAEDALRNVATATGLRSGIPERPPLQSDIHHKSDHRQQPQSFLRKWAREIGKESGSIARARSRRSPHFRQAAQQGMHAAGGGNRVPGDSNHNRHLQCELKQIGPEHAPQSAQRDVEAGEWNQKQNADRQRVAVAHAQA